MIELYLKVYRAKGMKVLKENNMIDTGQYSGKM